MSDEKKPKVSVNITKKRTTMIDMDGNVISESGGKNNLKDRMRARAKRLGLPFKE